MMYNPKTGIFSFGNEAFPRQSNYEFDATYYINFNASKALFALEKIEQSIYEEESVFLCHVYLDLLFQAVGMIINRFKPNPRNASDNLKHQARININEYDYTNDKYPLLNDKDFRNFIEHIDEKDSVLIDYDNYYGTFNLVYPNMNNNIKKELLNRKKKQNNLLNLEKKEYRINIIKNEILIEKNINLIELKKEITCIKRISEIIWNAITTPKNLKKTN